MRIRTKIIVNKTWIKIITIILAILIMSNFRSQVIQQREDKHQLFVKTSETNDSEIEQSIFNSRSSYTYHNYTSLVDNLKNLNSTYPDLMDINTTQELYTLPDCKDGYKIWVVKITNEKLRSNKPEVLFIGGHHGDEDISIETPFYLIEFLLTNYKSNNFVRYLIDHREIYIIPALNPWGWENNIRYDGNDQDINRDYPYSKSGAMANSDGVPLSTIGAKSVEELMKRHIFILSLSWHSGLHAIYYAWGTPKHDTPSDESPDNIAFFEVAKLMSDNAAGESKYPYGPANQVVYYADGAWSDYSYAASWDTVFLEPGFDTPGARSLAIGVEISNAKVPEEALLGNSNEILNPGSNIGFISQNIRMALVMIDLAEPYLTWSDSKSNPIPNFAKTNNNITLSWYVNGSFSVSETNILYGMDPNPINNYQFNTKKLNGGSSWSGTSFSQNITLPDNPGDYYFVAHAKVDQQVLVQSTPEPNVHPQSFFASQRTNDSYNITIDDNWLEGKSDWYSPVIHIQVKEDMKNDVEIMEYTKPVICNRSFNITWEVTTDGFLNETKLYWGQTNDPMNTSEFIMIPDGKVIGPGDDSVSKYYSNFTLPKRPGNYSFIAQIILKGNSSNTSNELEFWSKIVQVEAIPEIPYTIAVSTPGIEYIDGDKQTLTLSMIVCESKTISDEPLNNSMMISHLTVIAGFDPKTKTIDENKYFSYNLLWSNKNQYWHLPTQNISTWDPGWYLVYCKFKHKYGSGQSNNEINLELSNWFILRHVVKVNTPTIQLVNNETEYLNILNVKPWCSKQQLGYLDNSEVINHSYEIYNLDSGNLALNGSLVWSSKDDAWSGIMIAIGDLNTGNYYVVTKFSVDNIGEGKNEHRAGDKTEFFIQASNNVTNDKKEDNILMGGILLIIVAVILIIFVLIFLVVLLKIRKKN